MDRARGAIKISGIENFKSMVYTLKDLKDLDEYILKLENKKKYFKNKIRVIQSVLNAHYEERENLIKSGQKNEKKI